MIGCVIYLMIVETILMRVWHFVKAELMKKPTLGTVYIFGQYTPLRNELICQWVPRGGVDLALAFLSEGPRFEPCPRQLWKKLFQDESSDSRTREWDESARTNRGLA